MAAPSRIRVLPEQLANKIAAGEVVQRPASALKELVENSLDAGARSVQVDLEGGGIRRIRVRDDGEGMTGDDALLAFERHATSKLVSVEDLERVMTLGFRGEALPSIAAVSKITLTTRRAGERLGIQVRIEGGRILGVTEMGSPEGTEADMRSLFYNVPARRKFLRRHETELARCVETVSRTAMAHPGIAFRLRHGGKILLDLPPAPDRLRRAISILGSEAAAHLIALPEREQEELRVSGWVGAPALNRSNREGQFLFVNGRPVRDRLLGAAVYEAYHSFLPRGRHPVFALFVDLPLEGVDVNVHPAKDEVRFREASRVYGKVREAVNGILGAAPPGSRLIVHRPGPPSPRMPSLRGGRPIRPFSARALPELLGGGGYIPAREDETPWPATPEAADGPEGPSYPALLERLLQPPEPSDPIRLSACRYLGQWEECFLLFAAPHGLVFVDQHAAHERVLYNRFRDDFREGRVDVQALLVPQEISLRPEEALRLEAHRDTLERSGFEMEAGGPGTYRIQAVPALLADRDPVGAIRQVVEGLADLDEPLSFPDIMDGIITRMSCRRAIKAEQSMRPEEVAALVAELERTPGRWTCPHGRPLMLVLGAGVVRRRFLR